MTEIEFLKARLDELECEFEGHDFDYTAQDSGTSFCRHTSHVSGWSSTCPKATHSALIRAQIVAQRKIIEINEEWPILVETEPVIGFDGSSSADYRTMTMTQQIAFITNRKYREAFGDEPPTTPVIRALIQPFSDHSDFDPGWRMA